MFGMGSPIRGLRVAGAAGRRRKGRHEGHSLAQRRVNDGDVHPLGLGREGDAQGGELRKSRGFEDEAPGGSTHTAHAAGGGGHHGELQQERGAGGRGLESHAPIRGGMHPA